MLQHSAARRNVLKSIHRLLQEVYSALVRKMGFTRLTVADDGKHALDCLQQSDYDVVLMDCEMPRLSGPEYAVPLSWD